MIKIEAHFLKGSEDTLVITFNEMWNQYGNQRFWGENALRKCNLSACGITSNGPHWYPLHETIRALREPVKIARSYRNIVLYGYSMGAYAALKYSWLFDNPIILAFSPQFSINPVDLNGTDTRYDDFYNPLNRDIKIEPIDINGRGYIFYDSLHAADSAHVDKLVCGLEKISLPYCGHATIQCIYSSLQLKEMVRFALMSDTLSVQKIVRNGRKRNPFYNKYLLMNLLSAQHYSLAVQMARVAYANSMLTDPEALGMAAEACKRTNDYLAAVEYYKEAFALTSDGKYSLWAADALAVMADNCKRTNDYLAAVEYYKEAFALTSDGKYSLWAADALAMMADNCKRTNDYLAAVEYYKEAFALTSDGKYSLWAADALAMMADNCKRTNDYLAAVEYYKEAFALTSDGKYSLWAADALAMMADNCKRTNDYLAAVEYYKEAFALTSDGKYSLWANESVLH